MNFWKFPEVGSFSIKKKDMLQISHYIEAKFVDTKKNIKKCQHFLECLQRILPKRDKGSFGKNLILFVLSIKQNHLTVQSFNAAKVK